MSNVSAVILPYLQIATFQSVWLITMANFFLIKPTDALISQIYFCQETLHVSGSSCAHHQEFSTVHSALVYVMQVWWQLSSTTRWSCLKAVIKPAWHMPVPNVQWKTPDDGQRNCPKHVEFLDKNKFGKLMRLLVLLKTNICSVISLGYGNLGEENLCPTLARIWPRFLGLWKP